MSDVEVFLDDTPGEVRGIVTRDGLYERLIVQRDTDEPRHRLGALSVGRIARVESAFRAAFVDMGCDGPMGFLPLARNQTVKEGEAVEVEVIAEPRERKGPALRLLKAGQGPPRLLAAGPSVEQALAVWAPGIVPTTGVDAIRAGLEAEEDALATLHRFPAGAFDLAVQRTRALVAVDIDYAHLSGRDARKGRDRANRDGLAQTARLVALKGWGGLVVVDLVGTSFDPKHISDMARGAFGGEATLGPVSRFGLLQLTLPWRRSPIEEVLLDVTGQRTPMTRAVDLTRQLRLALLSDTAVPQWTARCAPRDADAAGPLVALLGPRAALRSDPSVLPGQALIEQG